MLGLAGCMGRGECCMCLRIIMYALCPAQPQLKCSSCGWRQLSFCVLVLVFLVQCQNTSVCAPLCTAHSSAEETFSDASS